MIARNVRSPNDIIKHDSAVINVISSPFGIQKNAEISMVNVDDRLFVDNWTDHLK